MHRRVVELRLRDFLGIWNISDEEFDTFDKFGRSMVTGYLKFIDINNQQRHMTQSLPSVAPTRSRIKWSLIIR